MRIGRIGGLVCGVVLGLVPGAVAPAAATAAAPASAGTIVSVDSDAAGKCLEVNDGGRGTWIQMARCNNGLHQDWEMRVIVSSPQTIVSFRNWASRKCLDTFAGRGNQLFQWPCNVTDDDQWIRLHNLGDGRWGFESVNYPGQCLDIRDWGRGAEVMLWDCHFGTNQQWIMHV